MSDIIRLDKVLKDLISKYRDIELTDRQKDLAFFEKDLSDPDDRERYVKKAKDMVEIWSNKDEKDIIVYALRVAIDEVKRNNNW